jgi:hypothetical protein
MQSQKGKIQALRSSRRKQQLSYALFGYSNALLHRLERKFNPECGELRLQNEHVLVRCGRGHSGLQHRCTGSCRTHGGGLG